MPGLLSLFPPVIVQQYIDENFPRPTINIHWLIKACSAIEKEHSLSPSLTEHMTSFIRALESAILHARWADIMEKGSGLPPFVGFKSMYVTIDKPIVLELVHMDEVGTSAFVLEKVRLDREHAIFSCFSRASSAGRTVSLSELSRLEDSLPDYPRNTVKLYLTDGAMELEAVELRRIPGLDLGRSPMGLKVRLEGVPIVGGLALLEPRNTSILGGCVEGAQENHYIRLRRSLQFRMQEELHESKVQLFNYAF